MNKTPYDILGINYNASKEEIKKAYRDIALSCHPDKLLHIDDENEKNIRIDKFKEATIAYETLINNTYTCNGIYESKEWNDTMDWTELWYSFFNKENVKDTLVDIANQFIQSKIHHKSYYNPTSNLNIPKRHDITLQVSYNEILTNSKKKLRLILVDIDEPLFIDIYCGNFPLVIKEYTDDDDIVHEIAIKIEITKQDNWDYLILNSGCIDIITSLDISLHEHVYGTNKKIKYIDGNDITINIPPMQKDYLEIKSKGLKGGSLILNLCLQSIRKEKWDNLSEKNKADMIRILELLT